MKRTVIPVLLALASAGAGIIHLLVAPEHLEEFTPFGVGFFALGAFQILWAVTVVVRPNLPILAIGLVVSALTIGTWIVSRTVGLPVGPEAGEAEAIGTMDLLATILEGVVVIGAAYLMAARDRAGVPVEYRSEDWQGSRAA